MFISNLEDLIPIMNEEIRNKLLILFKDKVNEQENNMMILLYQMQVVFENSNIEEKNKILEQINNMIN